jgi:hypothetical protein
LKAGQSLWGIESYLDLEGSDRLMRALCRVCSLAVCRVFMLAHWLQISGIPLALIGPVENPVLVFLIILTIMLVAPLLFERLRLPGIIG